MVVKKAKTKVELPVVEETSKTKVELVVKETVDSYWTPVEKTNSQYEVIKTELQKEIAKAISAKFLKCPVGLPYKFINPTRPANSKYVADVYVLLDGYSYSKSKQSAVVDAILNHFNITDKPDQFIKSAIDTKFMYKGVMVVLVHWEEGYKTLGKRFYSDGQPFLLGYNGDGVKLINILLNRFNFRFDEYNLVNYDLKNEHSEIFRTFNLNQSLSLACKLLDIEEHGYPLSLHGNMQNIGQMVQLLMASDYIGKDTFYIDENNNYTGPADYFGCRLFEDIVFHLRTDSAYTKPDYPTHAKKTPDAIWKAQYKIWQSIGGAQELVLAKESYQADRIISSKLTNSLISEITGKDHPDVLAKFRKMFEDKVSETEDFQFFMLSSSEDTVRARAQEFRNSLLPKQL